MSYDIVKTEKGKMIVNLEKKCNFVDIVISSWKGNDNASIGYEDC